MFRLKWNYLTLALLLLGVLIVIALFVNDRIIRPIGGDFLVVIFLYCLLRGIIEGSSFKVAVFVLIFAFSVEISQYFGLIDLLGLSDRTIAKLILGHAFSWWDMLAYALGILTVFLLDNLSFRKTGY